MEKQLEMLEILYPDNARGVAKFNVPLAHMIIAGADFMMIPSRFEPCGLIQLHAMRYGTVKPFFLFCLLLWFLGTMQNVCSNWHASMKFFLYGTWDNYIGLGAYCCLNWWAGWHCQRRLHWISDGSFQCWCKYLTAPLPWHDYSAVFHAYFFSLSTTNYGNSEIVPFGCIQCEAVDPADVTALATTVKRALPIYGTPALTEMIQNCMAQDFSWKVVFEHECGFD